MSTRKKGNITTSSEWARHLRPIMKRLFWRGERNAEDMYNQAETEGQYIETVEELLSEINGWSNSEEEHYLFVKLPLTFRGKLISPDAGMAIVVDAVLSNNYFPDGAFESQFGTKYKYSIA